VIAQGYRDAVAESLQTTGGNLQQLNATLKQLWSYLFYLTQTSKRDTGAAHG
jgi:hypothetical protein